VLADGDNWHLDTRDSREKLGQPSNTKQQPQKRQQQQQNIQNFPSIDNPKAHNLTERLHSPPASGVEDTSEQSIHLILNKEEMERMNKTCGHQIDYRLDNLPAELDILVTEVVDACHFWAVIDYKVCSLIQHYS
jgi:hypothetical protein